MKNLRAILVEEGLVKEAKLKRKGKGSLSDLKPVAARLLAGLRDVDLSPDAGKIGTKAKWKKSFDGTSLRLDFPRRHLESRVMNRHFRSWVKKNGWTEDKGYMAWTKDGHWLFIYSAGKGRFRYVSGLVLGNGDVSEID